MTKKKTKQRLFQNKPYDLEKKYYYSTKGGKKTKAQNIFEPTKQLIVKIGSIVGHIEEIIETGGHDFDVIAIKGILADKEVQEWLDGLRKKALLPEKRGIL